MKKYLIYLMISIIMITSVYSVHEVVVPVFSDNFNRADSDTVGNGWVDTGDGVSCATNISSNTLKLWDTSICTAATQHDIDSFTRINYTFMVQDVSDIGCILRAKGGTSQTAFFIGSDRGTHFEWVSAGESSKDIITILDGIWYNFTLDINYTSYTADVYIDGVFKNSNSFKINNTIDDISFTTDDTSLVNQNCYFDNLDTFNTSIENGLTIDLTFPSNGSTITKSTNDFLFNVNLLSDCTLNISDSSLTLPSPTITNILGFGSFGNIFLDDDNYTWNVKCTSANQQTLSTDFYFVISDQEISMIECPNTTSNSLFILLMVGLSTMFILFGFLFRNGMIGTLGSIMLLVSSWYVSACIAGFAYVMALLSIFLFSWFLISGFGFDGGIKK